MLDSLNQKDRIVLDPSILVGKPIIRGTRLSVEHIIELLANGWSQSEVLASYPALKQSDILACLGYAHACLLEGPHLRPSPRSL